ncbi:CoA-transferase family III domain-containing protein [Mycena maculata]|uniref:CoA-transferase family III domain-containing protein n=1 Tax=Mycena maculata TaxID=230809 RepID=A0AAD7MSK6_9AGAR|nr:CoA-transferase family III domain-containing protein [Mycena maculata]
MKERKAAFKFLQWAFLVVPNFYTVMRFLCQLISGPFAGQLLGYAPKKGDALRVWRELDVDACSPWFRNIGRNKKSVAIDLPYSRRPRVSRGQTGPWASRSVFASVCEAESGFRFINGFPDPEPGRPQTPVLALLQRQRKKEKGESGGTTVAVSIPESTHNLMEGIIPTYGRIGTIRGPSGSSVTGIAQNHQRVAHQAEIEAAIGAWTRVRSAEEVEARCAEARVPVGRVVSVCEIVDGEQEVWVPRKMPGTFPQLEGCNPTPRRAGPDLGIAAEMDRLRGEGVIE